MEEMEPVVRQENDGEIKPEPSRWYEGHISLEDAKTFIKTNITTAARSFIAIGFYLKCVRDRELFKEEGYQNIWDFAKAEYGLSKTYTSRYMSMNDRFSENGNSPNVQEKFKAFDKSKLQEMLSLEDEQLKQITPEYRVEDIRNLRKPKEIPYIELPGQLEFEIDFPDILPDQPEAPVILQKQTFEMNVEDLLSGDAQGSIAISQQEPEENSQVFEDKRKEEWLIRCEILKEMCNALCSMNSELLEKGRYSMEAIRSISGSTAFSFGFRIDQEIYKADYYDSIYHVEKFSGDGKWEFNSGTVEQQIWNFNGREWHNAHPDEQKPETSQLEDTGYYNPDDEKEVDESFSFANTPKASDRHVTMLARLFVQEKKGRLIYGGEAIGITDERIVDMLELFYHSQKPIIIDNDVEVSVGAEIIEFSRGDEDLGICLFKKFANYVKKQIDEYINDHLEEDQDVKTENNQENGAFNSEPTSCSHREGYSCTVPAEKRTFSGDGHNCGSSCCWSCKYHGMCKLECNSSAGCEGEIPEYDAAWFVKEWAKRVPEELKGVLNECREQKNNTDRAKAVQKYIAPYGYHGKGCAEYNFTFHGFAGGIDLEIGKVDIHLKYGRFVQELMSLYPDLEEAEIKEPETVIEEPDNVPEQEESVPESTENVIDGEYVEVPSEPEPQEYTPRYFLDEQNAKLKNFLRITKGKELCAEDIKTIERQKVIVGALASMVTDLENVDLEPVKQKQPELPILKNNDQRAAFIDAYETWPLWIETKGTGERYYRYDLSDGTSMVVKVYHAMLFDYKATSGTWEDRHHEGYGRHEYYLLHEGKFFRDCETNRSYLIEKLKEIQKKK